MLALVLTSGEVLLWIAAGVTGGVTIYRLSVQPDLPVPTGWEQWLGAGKSFAGFLIFIIATGYYKRWYWGHQYEEMNNAWQRRMEEREQEWRERFAKQEKQTEFWQTDALASTHMLKKVLERELEK